MVQHVTYMMFSGHPVGACTGSDGSVDFDYVRVGEEKCHVCMLKNKGKFDIDYMYVCVVFDTLWHTAA